MLGKKDDVYKEHMSKYIKLLRLISKNKIDNCRNKFNFLDKISSINGHGLDNFVFDSMVNRNNIPHIDRKPPVTNGQRLITDYYKSKPKSSSKSK